MISIILTIHNQEEIIEKILDGLFENLSSLTKEVIIIFDGCTDNSEELTRHHLRNILPFFPISYYITPNLFETRANNIGLKAVTQPYAIIVQDDCLIQERAFDARLIKPMLYWKDLFAVSGRDAHDIIPLDNGLVDYTNLAKKDRDFIHVRQVVNRGPLALDMQAVRLLDYFDESFAPQNGDDHDLCLRAVNYGYHCGGYPIFFQSNNEWGGTRKGDGTWIRNAIHKNMQIIHKRYSEFLKIYNPMEERYLP